MSRNLYLAIRTDNPDAEILLVADGKKLDEIKWHAHRQLAETIHDKIRTLFDAHTVERGDIVGIIAYQGPGSFTGLRIGLSVANAFGASYDVPVIGGTGDGWWKVLPQKLDAEFSPLLPDYGAPVHITPQKK